MAFGEPCANCGRTCQTSSDYCYRCQIIGIDRGLNNDEGNPNVARIIGIVLFIIVVGILFWLSTQP